MRSSGLMLGIGLAIGLAIGAGGMYLALARPWRPAGARAAAPSDAGVDAGAAPTARTKKKRRPGAGGGGPADPATADTRMVWKGDAIARPPASVDLGEDGEARALDAQEIQAGIDGGASALERCVEQGLAGIAWSGDVTVKLLVDGHGQVTQSRVRAPAFTFDHGLYACVRAAAGRLRFAAVGGWTVVTVPFPVSMDEPAPLR